MGEHVMERHADEAQHVLDPLGEGGASRAVELVEVGDRGLGVMTDRPLDRDALRVERAGLAGEPAVGEAGHHDVEALVEDRQRDVDPGK